MKKMGIVVSLSLCLLLLSTSAFAWGDRVTGQTVYVPIDYHQNFPFTVSVEDPCPPCTLPPPEVCDPCSGSTNYEVTQK